MLSDLRYALRRLGRTPGFTAVAMLTLALGIGINTAIFGALRALVLDPLPYPEPERLAQVWSGPDWPLSTPDYFDLRDGATSFAEFGAYSPEPANLGGERPQTVSAVACTAGVLRAFGVPPLLGRWLEPADEAPGAPAVAVINHALWRDTFASDPSVVGRSVRLNGSRVTVVGVMPAAFEFAAPWMRGVECQLWTPLRLKRGEGERGTHWICGLGRLNPGVTVGAADAEIKAIGKRLSAAYPASNTAKAFLVRSLHFEMTHQVASGTWLLFGAVGLVQLIACANVASMLLARGSLRSAELGLRTALGATRTQVIRLVLCESLLLAAGGAALGLVVADLAGGIIMSTAPTGDTRKAAALVFDHGALLFTGALTLATALLAGLPSALSGTRASIADLIRGDSRSATASPSRHRLLRTLVVAQIVVAFVLANGAALFSTSYLKLQAANRDLSSESVLSAELNLRGQRYEDVNARSRFCEQLVERATALPGVAAAGTTSKLPLEGGCNTNILVGDETFDPAIQRTLAETSCITPGYFATAGIRLVRGRTLQPGDAGEKDFGIVVNRALAEKSWPGRDPLGQIVRNNDDTLHWKGTVVGVVEDVRQWGPTMDPQPEIYWTPDHAWGNTVFLLLRSHQPADQLAAPLRQALASLDPDLPLARIRTLKQLVRDATFGQRSTAWLVDAFMALALGLFAIGLYGTLGYLTQQRTREIGIRLALGAGRRRVLQLVIGQALRWVLCGVALGAAGSLALATVLRSMLWGVGPINLPALFVGLAVVATVALLACWLPARRATRIDPIVALRAE